MISTIWHRARASMGPLFRAGDKGSFRRALRRIALASLLIVLGAGAAHAHAVLLGTDPPYGAALAQAPQHLVLRFNEPVTPLFVRLVDSTGRERALPQGAHAIDREVHAPLPADLGSGTYVASYRVVSADGHPVGGAILFAIGGAPGDVAAVAQNPDSGWRVATIANRALHLVCLFLAAGGLLFAAFVARDGGVRRGAFAGAAAFTGLLGIALHGATLAGGMEAASASFWQTALATPQAASALASLAGLALAFLAAPRICGRAGSALAIAGAAFALAAAGVTGHSAADGRTWWLVAAVHLCAAGFWFGSLPPLWRALRAEQSVATLRRFSRIAVPAVTALALAGAALALQRMDGLSDLVTTDYGRLVLAKLAGAVLLVAIAARNKLALTPALAHGGSTRPFRRAIALELSIMTAIVALAAVLAHTNPHAGHAQDHLHHDASPGVMLHLESGTRIAAVMLAPAKPGKNTLTVRFASRAGELIAPLEATLELSLPAAGIEGLSMKLAPQGAGTFAAEIAEMALPGRWQIRIDTLITDFEKTIFRGEVELR